MREQRQKCHYSSSVGVESRTSTVVESKTRSTSKVNFVLDSTTLLNFRVLDSTTSSKIACLCTVMMASCGQRNFYTILKISFKTDVAPKHDFGQVPVSRKFRKTVKEAAPRKRERDERVRTQRKQLELAKTTVFICRNQGFADLNRKTA